MHNSNIHTKSIEKLQLCQVYQQCSCHHPDIHYALVVSQVVSIG